MLPKGILFDLDDTIIAYSEISKPIWKQVCIEFSAENEKLEPGLLYDKIKEISQSYWSDPERHRIGRSDLNRTRRKIMEMVFEKLGVDDILLAHKIGETFQRRRDEEIYLFKGAKETVEYMHDNGVALAMMTNGEKEKQRAKIEKFDLERYFKVILIEGEQVSESRMKEYISKPLKVLASNRKIAGLSETILNLMWMGLRNLAYSVYGMITRERGFPRIHLLYPAGL